MKKVWNVGIYARVSTEKKEQQESIPAQVQSLKKWLIEKSKSDNDSVYNLIEVYEDSGFSGSNFDRESFIRMKEDIDSKKINMVLTRDLSRFSRNYILAGYYLEDYFKVNNVRFISMLDNVDTLEEFNDIIPFKNILNEMYIKDCSRRTRDGLKQRMIRGSSIASKPPYGYSFKEEINGNVKTIRIVSSEDETTEVIREIFDLYIQGFGFGKIATYLNKNNIKPPSSRLNFPMARFGLWTNNSIRYILTNPKYGGRLIQQRYKKISYKVKKIIRTPKEEWINGGDFDGIIDKATFDKVQTLIKLRSKNYRYKGNNIHIFSSVLKCNECGGSMSFRKKYGGYKCTNSQMGGNRCSAHSVKEEFLKQTIVDNLKSIVSETFDKDLAFSKVQQSIVENNKFEKQLISIDKELQKLDKQFEKLYMDKLNDIINQRNFEIIIKDIQIKQEDLIRKKEELVKVKDVNNKEDIYKLFKVEIDKILSFKDFNRYDVEKLVDKIIVKEDKRTGKKQVDIFYKFAREKVNKTINR